MIIPSLLQTDSSHVFGVLLLSVLQKNLPQLLGDPDIYHEKKCSFRQVLMNKKQSVNSYVINQYAITNVREVLVIPLINDRGKFKAFVLNVASVPIKNPLAKRCTNKICKVLQKKKCLITLHCQMLSTTL